MTWAEQLERDGYALLPAALTPGAVAEAVREWAEVTAANAEADAVLTGSAGPAYGARNLLDLWPGVVDLVRTEPVRAALHATLGPGAGVVRVLYFDKPPGHSWALPWHKDYSLAVKEHRPSSRFTKPTVKAGVPHVIAPQAVLDRMLTVRIHLDPMTPDNGPLRVVPGSHRFYDQRNDEPREAVTLECGAGDALLMRPLLTHASGHSKTGAGLHRRIVHLECAADDTLPDGFEWMWCRAVDGT
ncbi:Phytanoyl-CoA dioxygenase (PhyH) [Gemmata obscuriglobus]|uniref:Phytanoyl-CoA dioxygenase n=1 Tax=Gemmata obscuriglobus TaxID=114 RepID=A0A2Z3H7V5_9BACT|nr:phytanoyl-CoA dioxygenase family protein [Gemmata obscuriglobus]AWM39065.1 phytanoyl-CoA dioxygenase [Gemmata obscuriglobus]QEG27900.1 Phytanoyl-CoA dioxygenase (PhyH) [Gemmata obscuriglobus]VTS05326.1 Phytanoyl-CoA dioxygenase OS=Rhodopirellula maiorica SM1 GN=RMSM_07019 PE=4 SV=1: PhyH [Gemmata obscuriglobus UQM 2246]